MLSVKRFTPTGVGTMPSASASSTFAAVHPHGRGDNDVQFVLHNLGVGSPPRAWGQLRARQRVRCAVRFTPPGVGTIRSAREQYGNPTVHPHGRGDNLVYTRNYDVPPGSPPRAWGQFRRAGSPDAARRFTPTGVGTITQLRTADRVSPVHPHGRGDNLPKFAQIHCAAWFTPTGVGTIRRRAAQRVPVTVHPHGRGDNADADVGEATLTGSPPRAWGQYEPPPRPRRAPRFTPTGVGTMRSTTSAVSVSTVHPHGRGDNLTAFQVPMSLVGSPPRAWGQLASRTLRALDCRFTPTGVGTMPIALRTNRAITVHPHGRGDNAPRAASAASERGSPPRAWGQ